MSEGVCRTSIRTESPTSKASFGVFPKHLIASPEIEYVPQPCIQPWTQSCDVTGKLERLRTSFQAESNHPR